MEIIVIIVIVIVIIVIIIVIVIIVIEAGKSPAGGSCNHELFSFCYRFYCSLFFVASQH